MATRSDILHRLAALSIEELVELLKDDSIFQVAARYFERVDHAQSEPSSVAQPTAAPPVQHAAAVPPQEFNEASSSQRAKRPLNAFMAFRSSRQAYYLQLFPDIQQKTASGFLTTLWNKDPFRNRWALIAKVYSFVRDEVGKGKVSLSYFLGLCCPIMKVIEPAVYLPTLGWSIQEDQNGNQQLLQDEVIATMNMDFIQVHGYPSTEIELLTTLVNAGYLPEQAFGLVERMNSHPNGIMAPNGLPVATPIPYTTQKLDFLNTIRADPYQAARELFGNQYDDRIIRSLGVHTYNVNELGSIGHLQMQAPQPEPRYYYNYAPGHIRQSRNEVVNPQRIPDYDSIDIDSPFDVDVMLGHTQQEGERYEQTQSPPHDSRQDFHFSF